MRNITRFLIALVWAAAFHLPTDAQRDACAADARVMADALRLRAEPTTESRILGVLNTQTELMILRRAAANDWLYARTPDGLYGWVAAEYTQVYVDLAAVPVEETGILTQAVADHARRIFERGHAPADDAISVPEKQVRFSKVGDSITAARHFLQPIGEGIYNLGDYGALQAAVDYYAPESFSRVSLAAGIGWTTAAVLSPHFADPDHCDEGETPLECEYRAARPAVALIMLGTNDVSHLEPGTYCANLRKIVQISIERGVIPVLSTIPNRRGLEEGVAEFNRMVVSVAREYAIPLWDYGAAMRDLPDSGLDIDGAHPSIPPAGYMGAADFRANNLYYGYVIRNLTALHMLDAVRRAVVGE